MRGHLSVRIDDGSTSRMVTSRTRNLRFTKAAPGGHHSASMRLLLPRNMFRDLGPADKVFIFDSRTAHTVWEGYAENPGVTDGDAGQEFDLAAMGGMALASDQSEKLVYVDRDATQFIKQPNASRPARVETTADGKVASGFDAGNPVAAGYHASAGHYGLLGTSQAVGYIAGSWVGGKTDAGYGVRVGSSRADDALNTFGYAFGYDVSLTTAGGSFSVTPTATDHTHANLILRRSGGATNVTDDQTVATFSNLVLCSRLVDMDGTWRASVTEARTTDLIVRDLFWRMLKMCDASASTIEAASHVVDQLAYPDGATAAKVLEDLALFAPDYLWEILETQGNGKHRFNYRAWPTMPRYEISVRDGYSAPGGEVDLCNRIAVFWADSAGKRRTTVVTSTVPELGDRIRDADPVTLPEGRGSAANAQRIGEQVLAMKSTPPKAARAVVRRPILDHLAGSTVMPWEIEPGYLVRVRETGDDLRLTEMEYADEDCAATLTLGTPTRSFDQLLAGIGAG